MTRLVLAWCLIVTPTVVTPTVWAQSAQELWDRARAAEAEADPQRARSHYEQLAEGFAGTRLGRRAQTRLEWFDARRHGPLQELMRARLDDSPTNLERLEEALRQAPPSLVVREGWALLARSWERRGDVSRASAAYRRWMNDSWGQERQRAAAGLAALLERDGEREAARELLVDEELPQEAQALEQRESIQFVRVACAAFVALHLMLLLVLARRMLQGWRDLLAPRALGILVVVLIPAWLARAYDPESWDSFVWLLIASVPFLALAVLAGPVARRRRVVAASAFLAQLALGVLVYTR